MAGEWRERLARTGFRRRDFLLAVPMGVIVAVIAEMVLNPVEPGAVIWISLAISGASITLYLGMLAWDRR